MVEAGQRYRHYKTGNLYRIIALGKHSETLEPMVVYEAQYENPESRVWIRPLSMFEEMVEWPKGSGITVPRFALAQRDAAL
ncbi:MAG TPA: DUF1653 domain-containing protein [Candidatus Paceibacterota bacterium]|nr:DUF1653 domain-containing protein [Candidatus Paceibacterota bacterium]